ncbi:MAG: AMP-dependent synthetase and ligase [Pseudonocardiales bacterium]|nr:AMP-dependent synthetase and ligase [Pseudonocardiales bacterium]
MLIDGVGSVPLSLGTIAELNAAEIPAAEAVVDGERRLTWAQLHDRTARLAGALRSTLRCVRGDRVAFVGENCLEAFELFHAAARAGLLFVPLNDRLAPTELRAILDSVEPVALFHTGDYARLAAELVGDAAVRRVGIRCAAELSFEDLLQAAAAAPAVEPEPIASICFTSGTTGRPKGVLMTQVAQQVFARLEAELEPVPPGARHLFVRPMAVAPGHRMIAWHGLTQGTTVIKPRFDTAEFFRTVAGERITNVLLAPTMLRMLLDDGNPDGHDLSSLVCIVYGGAPMSPQLLRDVLDFFPCSLMQGYGGSEAGQVLYLSGADHRAGRIDSNGQRVPGVEVEMRAVSGVPLPVGEVGELHVRSEMLMAGYWRDPVNTDKVLRGGWYATGDLAQEEPDGYVRVVGRVSDMIISGGFNIMPLEVEEVLGAHPAVREVAVYATPDPLWGESVQAAVVVHHGSTVTAEELIALCRERLASFKKPQRILFVDSIPRTGVGKIDKRALREAAAAGSI